MVWIAKYHSYLRQKGRFSKPELWYLQSQDVMFPWFTPLAALLLWVLVFQPTNRLRAVVCFLVGIPTVLGMAYASVTYLVSAFRTHRARRILK